MTSPPEPWGLTDDEAGRFAEAIRTRRNVIPAGWLLRPGGSWSAKPGGILCTVVAYDPAEGPDGNGRRPSDLDAGQVLLELAAPLCDAYNARTGR